MGLARRAASSFFCWRCLAWAGQKVEGFVCVSVFLWVSKRISQHLMQRPWEHSALALRLQEVPSCLRPLHGRMDVSVVVLVAAATAGVDELDVLVFSSLLVVWFFLAFFVELVGLVFLVVEEGGERTAAVCCVCVYVRWLVRL